MRVGESGGEWGRVGESGGEWVRVGERERGREVVVREDIISYSNTYNLI